MSFLTKLEQIDRRVVYFLLLLVIAIPVLHPIGLPLTIGDNARTYAAQVAAIPDGATVLYEVGFTAGGLADLRSGAVATLRQLAEKNVKVVFVSCYSEGPVLFPIIIKDSEFDKVKKYGTDYAFLGFIAGRETGMAALARDIRSVVPKDYYGTPLDQLPVMKGINGAKDFHTLFVITDGTDIIEGYIRQWIAGYKVRALVIVLGPMGPSVEPFFPAQVQGLMYGSRMGAEYELILRKPGVGLSLMDAESAAHSMIIILIILGNLAYAYRRAAKKGGK